MTPKYEAAVEIVATICSTAVAILLILLVAGWRP